MYLRVKTRWNDAGDLEEVHPLVDQSRWRDQVGAITSALLESDELALDQELGVIDDLIRRAAQMSRGSAKQSRRQPTPSPI